MILLGAALQGPQGCCSEIILLASMNENTEPIISLAQRSACHVAAVLVLVLLK